MSDVWSEASRDFEAEHYVRVMAAAKAQTEGVWRFLAQATSTQEYEHRKAIASEKLFRVAAMHDLPAGDLMAAYDRQFGLLMEAKDFTVEIKDDDPDDKGKFDDGKDDDDDAKGKDDDSDSDDSSDDDDGNPFGKDDSDDDHGDDKGGNPPVTTKPHQKPDENAQPGDDGGNGGKDDGSDDDDDSDDDKDSDDSDGGDDKDDDDGKPAFLKGSSRYATLLARIEAGENPLRWVTADGGMPTPTAPTAPAGATPMPSSQSMPTNGGTPSSAMSDAASSASPSTPPPVSPSQDSGSGDDSSSPSMASTGGLVSLASIAEYIGESNPNLPYGECIRLAKRAHNEYLVRVADGGDPLTFGDRGNTADGPLTSGVKNFSPPDLTGGGGSSAPDGGGGGSDSDSDSDDGSGGSGGGSKGGGGGGGGMAGAAVGTALKFLPDLLMAANRK